MIFPLWRREWVERVTAAQRIAGDDHAIGTEWMQGPYGILRDLRCLQSSLREIRSGGSPKIPGGVRVLPNGQVAARVFPQTFYDRILFQGYQVDVWMEPDVTLENFNEYQAVAYRTPQPAGSVVLVLGAGNLAGIPATDTIDKLFVQNQVVALKMNPVNDYMGAVFARGFRCLIEAGVLRILYGGAGEGAHLCQHPGVDEVFITGSDKTFDAIVFGPGEEGARRKGVAPPAEAIAQMRARVIETFERQQSAFYTSGLMLDDGVIDPRDSRAALGLALSAACSNEVAGARSFGVFRM